MRKTLWILLTLTLLSSGHVFAASPLRIATEGAYPPFNEIDAKGNLIGFDVDIAKALCKSMGVECTIRAIKWDDLLPGLAAGKFDVIVASMARTAEREKIAAFTDFYYRSRTTFVADPTKKLIQTREGLTGLVIAAQKGTVQATYLMNNFNGTSKIKLTKTNNDAFDLLAKDEVDLVLSDSLTIFEFLQTDAGTRFDFVGPPLPAEHMSSEARIAVRKNDDRLLHALNKALKEIRLSGVYDRINRRYFPFSIY